jgi:hypothetical protein
MFLRANLERIIIFLIYFNFELFTNKIGLSSSKINKLNFEIIFDNISCEYSNYSSDKRVKRAFLFYYNSIFDKIIYSESI